MDGMEYWMELLILFVWHNNWWSYRCIIIRCKYSSRNYSNCRESTWNSVAFEYGSRKNGALGRYSQIGLNKSLSKMGLKGGAKRPDVIGVARKGKNKLVEVVSRSQKVRELTDKTVKMVSQNTNTTGKVISMKWARLTPKKWRLYKK